MAEETEGWETTAGEALREAAKKHSISLGREREIARQATTRALAAEGGISALPLTLQRVQNAELALRALHDKALGEAVGSDAEAKLRMELQALQAPEGAVSEKAATEAAAQAATAGWEAADTAARAERVAVIRILSPELEAVEIYGAACAAAANRADAERSAREGELVQLQLAYVAQGRDLEGERSRVRQLKQTIADVREELLVEREARVADADAARRQADTTSTRICRLRLRALFYTAIGRRRRVKAKHVERQAQACGASLAAQVERQVQVMGSIASLLTPKGIEDL